MVGDEHGSSTSGEQRGLSMSYAYSVGGGGPSTSLTMGNGASLGQGTSFMARNASMQQATIEGDHSHYAAALMSWDAIGNYNQGRPSPFSIDMSSGLQDSSNTVTEATKLSLEGGAIRAS